MPAFASVAWRYFGARVVVANKLRVRHAQLSNWDERLPREKNIIAFACCRNARMLKGQNSAHWHRGASWRGIVKSSKKKKIRRATVRGLALGTHATARHMRITLMHCAAHLCCLPRVSMRGTFDTASVPPHSLASSCNSTTSW